LRADITGRNSSNWSLTHILYGNELYPSIPAFRKAWREPGFKKMKVNHGGDWINVESTGEEDRLMLDDRAPPRQVSVGGQRFKVNEEERYVEWMHFSFFITYVYLSYHRRIHKSADGQFHSRHRDEASRHQVPRREDHLLVRARRSYCPVRRERSCPVRNCLSRFVVPRPDFRSDKTDVQTRNTVLAHTASIRYRGMISHYKVIACLRLGMRMSYLR
jgi:hypothetical protein